MSTPPRPEKPSLTLRLAVSGVTTLVLVFVCALAFELRFRSRETPKDRNQVRSVRDLVLHGRVENYEGRPYTAYAKPGYANGHNALGFNDIDWSVQRTPGVPRVVCIGSSTTEGGNRDGREGSYPYQLEQALTVRYGRRIEVLNFGMSGWTSAEELVNWFLCVQDYRPDLVILHEAANDLAARNYRTRFRPDYVHYRKPWNVPTFGIATRLLVRTSDLFASILSERESFDLDKVTVNPPAGDVAWNDQGLPLASAAPYRRNLLSIAKSARELGATVVIATVPYDPQHDVDDPDSSRFWRVGMRQHNDILREMAREEGFVLVDIARGVADHPEEARGQFLDLVHVTLQGNRLKAREIDRVLARAWRPPFE
jgi:hypothetical protein